MRGLGPASNTVPSKKSATERLDGARCAVPLGLSGRRSSWRKPHGSCSPSVPLCEKMRTFGAYGLQDMSERNKPGPPALKELMSRVLESEVKSRDVV